MTSRSGFDRRQFLQISTLAAAGAWATSSNAMEFMGTAVHHKGSAKKVVILGAGMAGLTAAIDLKAAGHEVIVLEAKMHPGGRVHTFRDPFSDGLYAEAGAGRIPVWHKLTLEYVKRYGLTTETFYPRTRQRVVYWGGKRFQVDFGKAVPLAEVPLQLSAKERKEGVDAIYTECVSKERTRIGAVPPDLWPNPDLGEDNDMTIADFFRRCGLSEDAIRLESEGYEYTSAADFLRDAWSHSSPMLYKIHGGNDSLPRAMAAQLREQIRYGTQVLEIRNHPQQPAVTCSQAGTRYQIEADAIICTLPYSVLRHIAVTPAFSVGKQNVIQNMHYGNVSRVYLQTRTRYWEKNNCSGFAEVDQPMEIWNPSWNMPGTRGLLMAYTYERLAQEIDRKSPDERVAWFVELIDKVHPGIQEMLEGAHVWSWQHDPFQQGAYCVLTPHDPENFAPHLRSVEGRVHFAGEHTSPWPGWIQGAIYSGQRAAREVDSA